MDHGGYDEWVASSAFAEWKKAKSKSRRVERYMQRQRSHVAALGALSELQQRDMEWVGSESGAWFGGMTARLIAAHRKCNFYIVTEGSTTAMKYKGEDGTANDIPLASVKLEGDDILAIYNGTDHYSRLVRRGEGDGGGRFRKIKPTAKVLESEPGEKA